MTQRSTKWAEKKNCKNLKKTWVFTRFLQHKTPKRGSTIPNAAQEWPKVCQNAMQKNDKKKSKKCLRGKKCLKPAISFWIIFGPHFWWLFLLTFKLIVNLLVDHCLTPFRIPWWKPWWMKISQIEKLMAHNNHQRDQNHTKTAFSKKHKKKHEVFTIFEARGLSRMPQETQDFPNDAPTEFQISKEN